jgi:hypothetical protein
MWFWHQDEWSRHWYLSAAVGKICAHVVMVALFMFGWLCLVGADGNIGVWVVLVAICWWQYRRLQ